MTTTLEIIDTAVKVGLGAIISGITVYYSASKTNEHERKSELIVFKRNKLVEISDKIQLSAELANKLILQISLEREDQDAIVSQGLPYTLETTMEMCNLASSALQISSLINDRDLVSLLKSYWENRRDLHKLLLKNIRNSDSAEKYDSLKIQADEIRLKMYDYYSVAVDKVHA
jgi:uncharacterized protein YjgD (DUF1641 family)